MSELPTYARMAETHWREHCPRLVRELESQGRLAAALQEAHDLTAAEMTAGIRHALELGLTPDQAERQAWERVREQYILLPPEQPEATD